MTTPVIVQRFGPEDASFSLDALNQNFAAVAAAVNALAADTLLQLGVTPGNLNGYLPITGGSLAGQVTAPSVLVGPVGGTQYPVVTTNDAATTGGRGAVKQAVANVDVAGAVPAGGTGTAAGGWDTAANRDIAIATIIELKTRINALQAALRTAGVLAP